VQAVHRVWQDNLQVYGVRKVWRQLHREGMPVARCTVARLMHHLGIEGVVRGKKVRTTFVDAMASSLDDKVRRQFHAG
jgi:transposase InsO family protein